MWEVFHINIQQREAESTMYAMSILYVAHDGIEGRGALAHNRRKMAANEDGEFAPMSDTLVGWSIAFAMGKLTQVFKSGPGSTVATLTFIDIRATPTP